MQTRPISDKSIIILYIASATVVIRVLIAIIVILVLMYS